jgi:formylglycine-generating enzyme required for sulfatase activity
MTGNTAKVMALRPSKVFSSGFPVMAWTLVGLSATPSLHANNPNRPVEKVSWADVQIFLTLLNTQQSANIPAGWAYVLPTESQWEYACRAGTTTAYSWGATIASSNANYNWDGGYNTGVDFKQTRDVGQYAANPWGFFDMHGNVWELTADWYGATYPVGNPVIDPTGAASGSNRIVRGGSWGGLGADLHSARRDYYAPSYRDNVLGFRVGFQKQ